MYHYTYVITYSTGKKYIGVRSCNCLPEEDTAYVGSSKYTPNNLIESKEILCIFNSRKEALEHEIQLHHDFDVSNSSLFYNKVKQTSTGFNTLGVKIKRTPEHNQKIKEALTGRTRSEQECINISNAKKGKPLGPHSEETKQKMREARLGVDGYMKGKKYDSDDLIKLYSKRCKDLFKYKWINTITNEEEHLSCIEMGAKYVHEGKPSRPFRDIINKKRKMYKGWTLHNEDNLTNYPEQMDHIQYQGTDFNKAVIELADKEYINEI